MSTLRIPRLFSTFYKRHPIIDRFATCSKGGNLRNAIVGSKFNELLPLPFNSFATFSESRWKKTHGNTFIQDHTFSFSTSKVVATNALSSSDLKKAIDHLTDQFMETRELLEDARESVDTVYFSSDMEEASESVKQTLQEYQELLDKLSDVQKQEVIRTIGLKMEELKAQQQALEDES